MSKHKNNVKEFSAGAVAICLVFMALGLFITGAGFGGCVVCSIARGCSWTIGLPSLMVMFVGVIVFLLNVFTLLDGLKYSEGDI